MKIVELIIVICTTCILSSCCFAQKSKIIESDMSEQIPISSAEAQTKAMKYLGFSKMDGFSREANFEKSRMINIIDDKTPFLHKQINNLDVWKIAFQNITLTPDDRLHDEDAGYKRTFDVYIDPKDGKLLKIESIYSGKNVDFAPEPGIEWAEKSMIGSRYVFQDFADPDSNYVGLFDVLKSLGPRNFKQLKAVLVIIPVLGQDTTQVVWFVTYRGTDPYFPKSKGADLSITEAYNYQSFIYDAKSVELNRE